MPESRSHHAPLLLLEQILLYWASQQARAIQVNYNLAVRFDPAQPSVGIDPDLSVVWPPPPEGDEVESLCLWKPGHRAPQLAIEIVSPSNRTKDYRQSPARCDHAGVDELWVYDPQLVLPGATRHRLQVWSRVNGPWTRRHAGPEPARSELLEAWLVVDPPSQSLRLSHDTPGISLWPTTAEAEQKAKEAERKAKDLAIQAKETALLAKDEALQAKDEALEAQRAAQSSARKLADHLRSLGIDPDEILQK